MSALVVSEEAAAAVDRVARFVVRFGLTVPAILALESMRPISFVGSQFMHVLSPSVAAVLSASEWDAMAALLEDRRGLDYLIEHIEKLNTETERR
ncbi:MAG: hypothetical protein P8R54_00230 [Myxococcota bacterium]|nr:hypothetical protein [Myxococcota bacterium]